MCRYYNFLNDSLRIQIILTLSDINYAMKIINTRKKGCSPLKNEEPLPFSKAFHSAYVLYKITSSIGHWPLEILLIIFMEMQRLPLLVTISCP